MPADAVYSRNTGDWTLDYSLLVQTLNPGEACTIPCPFYLIEHPEGTVLFDTGVSHELAADPDEYGPFGAPAIADLIEGLAPGAGKPVREHLDDLGYAPGDVDHVILSHLHADHAGNVTLFPDAEILVSQAELRYAFYPDPVQRPFYLGGDFAPLRTGTFDVTPIEGRFDLFGDGSVEVFPTPGHSPGHQSVRVTLPETGALVLASDVANRRIGYENELVASFAWSVEESVRSLRKTKRIARETDADVVVHHEPDDQAGIPDDGLR